MGGKIFVWLLPTLFLGTVSLADAQQPAKIPRIGFLLVGGGSPDTSRPDAFRQGLRQLGYVEGKNIAIEWRYAKGNLDRLDELAAEIARLKVDVFVASGNAVTHAAKKATSTIPIVTALVSDPIENGFIASLARPGGNITGLTNLGAELSGKRLELLKETIPRLSRLMVLGNSPTPGNPRAMQQTETVARALSVQLNYKDVQNPVDIDSAFKASSKGVRTLPSCCRMRYSCCTENLLWNSPRRIAYR